LECAKLKIIKKKTMKTILFVCFLFVFSLQMANAACSQNGCSGSCCVHLKIPTVLDKTLCLNSRLIEGNPVYIQLNATLDGVSQLDKTVASNHDGTIQQCFGLSALMKLCVGMGEVVYDSEKCGGCNFWNIQLGGTTVHQGDLGCWSHIEKQTATKKRKLR